MVILGGHIERDADGLEPLGSHIDDDCSDTGRTDNGQEAPVEAGVLLRVELLCGVRTRAAQALQSSRAADLDLDEAVILIDESAVLIPQFDSDEAELRRVVDQLIAVGGNMKPHVVGCGAETGAALCESAGEGSAAYRGVGVRVDERYSGLRLPDRLELGR